MRKLTEVVRTELQEGLTKYMGVIGSDHAYIHKGIAFTSLINTGSISSSYKVGFTTPASDLFVHWRPVGVETSADFVQYDLYEGNSYSGGTTVTPINRNRNLSAANSSDMQTFSTGVTATISGSTLIQHGGIGTVGNAASRSGGGSQAAQEIVLKADTDYVLELTPAGATTVFLSLFWYEEEGFEAI